MPCFTTTNMKQGIGLQPVGRMCANKRVGSKSDLRCGWIGRQEMDYAGPYGACLVLFWKLMSLYLLVDLKHELE